MKTRSGKSYLKLSIKTTNEEPIETLVSKTPEKAGEKRNTRSGKRNLKDISQKTTTKVGIKSKTKSDINEEPKETIVSTRSTRSKPLREKETKISIKSKTKIKREVKPIETIVSTDTKTPEPQPEEVEELKQVVEAEPVLTENKFQSIESEVNEEPMETVVSKTPEKADEKRSTRSGKRYLNDGLQKTTTKVGNKSKAKSDINEEPKETIVSTRSTRNKPLREKETKISIKSKTKIKPEVKPIETIVSTDIKTTEPQPEEVEEEKEKEEKEKEVEALKEEVETESVLTENESQSIESEVNEEPMETVISKPLEKVEEKRKISPERDDYQPIKRIRVSRFSIPSIPQICGQLFSFGEEIAGELGLRLKKVDDFKLKVNEPSIVTDKDGVPLDNIVSVVCGAMHSSCLTTDGEVLTFGCNDDSALGRRTQTASDMTDDSIDADESEERESKTPKIVSGLSSVVKITAGDMHTCALTKDGSVFVWGNLKDDSKKLGLFANTLKIENCDDYSPTPLPTQIELETKIVDIASGCNHILLLTEDGDVLSLGDGSVGQLGRINDNELRTISTNRQLFLSPKKVEFGDGIAIEKIWANHWSSFSKTTSGDIYVWGLNNYHQLGHKSNKTVQILSSDPNDSQVSHNWIIETKPIKSEKMPANVVMIANGQHHMLALDSDGQVFSCGSNTYGKLGYETDDLNVDQSVDNPRLIPRDAFEGQKVSYIECGDFCSFAITETGHLMAWGQGSAHIGSEDFEDIEVPTRVMGKLAENLRFIRVSSGSQVSIIIGNKTSLNGN